MPHPDTLDVSTLQAAIERQARAMGPEPPFPQLQLRRLTPALREASRVEPNPPLIGRTAYERIWVVINRVVRRVVRHAVEPAVISQNEWNAATLNALGRMTAVDAALRAELVRQRAENNHDDA